MNTSSHSFKKLYVFFLVVCFLAVSQVGFGAEAPWYDGNWPHEHADFEPDATVTFGRLDNGFRYAVIPHNFPQGRVSMMLNVQTGSLMERDDELGYAHFVEHMAFNGSRNFKPGELIPFFQKHGMSFGGDTNAHTSFTETVYKLNLTDTSHDSIVMGARVLRDFADGVLFSEKEVEDELGVILAEKRSRDNEQLRASLKKRETLYAGTRFVKDIIGTENCLKKATGDKLRAFYERWYRPERMMLVVVGDVSPQYLKEIIETHFASLAGSGKAEEVPYWGEGKAKGLRAIFQEREHDAVTIALQTMHKRQYEPASKKELHDSLVGNLAQFCMQQRLDRTREQQPDVWLHGVFQNWSRDPIFPLAALTAVTTQTNWEQTLAVLSDELRSALKFGFTQQEMELALQQFKLSLQGAAMARKRMPSEELAMHFISAANNGNVFTSEEFDLDFFTSFAEQVTLDEVNAAFRLAFTPCLAADNLPDNLTIYVTGPKGFLTEDQILSAYTKAQKRPVAEKSSLSLHDFPYLPLPAKASSLPELTESKLASSSTSPILYTASLANGVQLRFLHYTAEEGQVRASLVFGEGSRIYDDSSFPAIDMLNSVLQATGVGKLDSQESMLLFGYRDMTIVESMNFESSVIGGSGRTEDLEFLLQALWTQYHDPVIEEKDRLLVLRSLELQQRIKDTTVDGVSSSKGRTFFYGDALRFTDLNSSMAETIPLAKLQNILHDSRQPSPLTILVGGDFDVEEALRISTQLFGVESINDTEGSKDGENNQPVRAASPEFPATRDTVINVDDPVAKSILRMVIRNDLQESSRAELAHRQLLAEVMGDRLRDELREKLGVVYGASVWYDFLTDNEDPGFGLFTIALVTGHENIDTIKAVVNAELKRLREEAVNQEELDRIRNPLITRWSTSRKKLGKWYALQLAELVNNKPHVGWNNEYKQLLLEITPQTLQTAAKELFGNGIDGTLLIYSDGQQAPEKGIKPEDGTS